jgi:hypothetical protein
MFFRSFSAVLVVVVLAQGSSCGKSNGSSSNSSKGTTNSASPMANVNSQPMQPSQKQKALSTGVWGGQHVSMEVTEEGATLEFDCAHGTISGRLSMSEDGKVTLKGRYAREHGGPIRQGEDQSGQPATYSGTSDGKTLTFTIIIDDSKEEIGTFTLTHGKEGRVRKCL